MISTFESTTTTRRRTYDDQTSDKRRPDVGQTTNLIEDTGEPRTGLIGGGAGEEPFSAGDAAAAAAADAARRALGAAASSEGGGGTPRWRTREAEQSGTAEDGKSEGNGGGGKRPLAPIETGS